MKRQANVKSEQLSYPRNAVIQDLLSLIRNIYFYIGLVTLIFGIQLNFFSQTYLYHYVAAGNTLPELPDLVLDNIPYWDIDFLYDIFCFLAMFIFIAYIVDKRVLNKVPYFLMLLGIFNIIRGIFIVLTPLGNPPLFDGTQGLFNGFSKYEFGVYPSGHIGSVFLYLILSESRFYRILQLSCMLIITVALLLARGHYSIDILSGILFAYAIKAFGDQYLEPRFSSGGLLNGREGTSPPAGKSP